MTDDQVDPLDGVGQERRDFIKKMALVVFATPVVSSFGMSAIAAAASSGGNSALTQLLPNQSFPNQSEPFDPGATTATPPPAVAPAAIRVAPEFTG